jgi:hypothetical protein
MTLEEPVSLNVATSLFNHVVKSVPPVEEYVVDPRVKLVNLTRQL